MDGAKSLKARLQPLFPGAIFTPDVCHVAEKLWALGRHFHPEGSAALAAWVEELKALVYAGKATTLVRRLERWLEEVPRHGPGTKARREALAKLIGYVKPRRRMMRYRLWVEQDVVIATGQVEGAVRHLVGERFDCAGMRWRRDKAEALLHLRCIELNRDWDEFVRWSQERIGDRVRTARRHKVLTNQPLTLARAG